MTLAEYLRINKIGKSEFGRRLAKRLGTPVPPQSVHRWTNDLGGEGYNVPRTQIVEAIDAETEGAVEPNSWFRRPRRRRAMAIDVAACRKAAAHRRRREAEA